MSPDRALAHGVLRAVVAVAAGAGLVAGAAHLPTTDLADADRARADSSARPVTSSALVCGGAELAGIDGVADREVPGTVGVATPPAELISTVLTRVLGADGSTTASASDAASLTPLAAATSATVAVPGGTASATRPQRPVLATADGALAPGLAAVQVSQAVDGDEFGLASVACGAPAADQWLLAGGGDAGRQERLLLTNATANPVTVDVTLHGTDGPVDSPVGKGLVVPARGKVGVLLDSISATERSPAVHVVASGGQVAAVLNDLWVDGTRAAGTDDVPPTAEPSTDQILPGVSSSTTTVRVAVPGSDEAVLQLAALTADGQRSLGAGGVVRVPGGAVVDVPLTDLPEGSYAVRVGADVPVVASAVGTGHRPGEVGDLAWTTATPAVRALAGLPLLALEGTTTRSLSLAAGDTPVSVEVVTVDAAGTPTSSTTELAAGAATSVALPATARSVWLAPTGDDTSDGVHAAVITVARGDGPPAITTTPLRDAPLTSEVVDLVAAGTR